MGWGNREWGLDVGYNVVGCVDWGRFDRKYAATSQLNRGSVGIRVGGVSCSGEVEQS